MNWDLCCLFPDHALRVPSGLSWTLHLSLVLLQPSFSSSPCSEGAFLQSYVYIPHIAGTAPRACLRHTGMTVSCRSD